MLVFIGGSINSSKTKTAKALAKRLNDTGFGYIIDNSDIELMRR